MIENRFEVNVRLDSDRTAMFPYKLFVKVTFRDPEFKTRIINVVRHSQPHIIVEDTGAGFLTKLFKVPPFIVKLRERHKISVHQPRDEKFELRLSDDPLESDLNEISFKEKNDAEFVKPRLEMEINRYLKEQEMTFLSIE